jgi:hypothetical protein
MFRTPEELTKAPPELLKQYLAMGDRSPFPRGAIELALRNQANMEANAQASQAKAQGNANPTQPTTIVDRIAEAVKQKIQSETPQPRPESIAGIGALPVRDDMFRAAEGGIVSFKGGGSTQFDYSNQYVPEDILRAHHGVESAFSQRMGPSSADALGPFQFQGPTGRQYGLKTDQDRLDFAKSKDAAARYLADLHNQFGNWELASMAYNWGPGNVRAYLRTGLGANGKPRPKESLEYPGKIAALTSDPEGFRNRGINRGGLPQNRDTEKSAPATAVAAAGAPTLNRELIDEAARLEKITERERDDALKALGEAPKAPTEEELLAANQRAYEQGDKFNKPFVDAFRAKVAEMKPDTARMKEENTDMAWRRGLAALGGSRQRGLGGFLGSLGPAMTVGFDSYEKGQKELREADRLHKQNELLQAKYEFEMAKGNRTEANRIMERLVDSSKLEMQLYRAGKRDVIRDTTANRTANSGIISALQRDFEGQRRDRREAEQRASSERNAQTRADAMLGAAGIRQGGGGGRATDQQDARFDRFMSDYLSKPEIRDTFDSQARALLGPNANPLTVREKSLELAHAYAEQYIRGSKPVPAAPAAPRQGQDLGPLLK